MPLLQTKACPECGRQDVFNVTKTSLDLWEHGAHVQNAFPYLNADQREQLITGLDRECWDRIMGPEPE